MTDAGAATTMSDRRSLVERLHDAVAADLAAATEAIDGVAARTFFDALVCMAAGAAGVAGDLVPADESGPVPIVGTARRGGLLGSVGANAIAAHIHDRDDLHWPTVTHPGSVIWPALLAVGASHDVALPALYRGAAVGYQTSSRLAALLGDGHRARFHASTTSGSVAVAAAASTALGATPGETVAAMAHAASVMGGTGQAVRERSRTSAIHRAASATLGCVSATQRRLSPAVRFPLEGPFGWESATGISMATDTLDHVAPVAIAEVTVRAHPVTGFAHTIVDAILDAPEVEPSSIDRVEVAIPSFIGGLTDHDPAVPVRNPAWDLPLIVGMALLRRLPAGYLTPDDVAQADPLRRLVRISLRPASPPDLAVEGRIRLRDGTDVPFERDAPDGHPRRPSTDDGLLRKAQRMRVIEPDRGRDVLAKLHAGGSLPIDAFDELRSVAAECER